MAFAAAAAPADHYLIHITCDYEGAEETILFFAHMHVCRPRDIFCDIVSVHHFSNVSRYDNMNILEIFLRHGFIRLSLNL